MYGTTHDSESQQTLQKVSGLLHKWETISIDIFPESDNTYAVRPLPLSVS